MKSYFRSYRVYLECLENVWLNYEAFQRNFFFRVVIICLIRLRSDVECSLSSFVYTSGRNNNWLSPLSRDISECFTLKCLSSKVIDRSLFWPLYSPLPNRTVVFENEEYSIYGRKSVWKEKNMFFQFFGVKAQVRFEYFEKYIIFLLKDRN